MNQKQIKMKCLTAALIAADIVLALIIGIVTYYSVLEPAAEFYAYKPLAVLGHAGSQFKITRLSFGNMDILSDSEKMMWLRKAAERGHANAQRDLAYCLSKQKDFKQAVHWYLKGAEQGDKDCQRHLIHYYISTCGMDNGLRQQVLSFYRQGAEKGDVKCLYQLGLCYQFGDGLPQDTGQALRCFRKITEHSAELSTVREDVWYKGKCAYRLGLYYKLGYGVPKDLKEAAKWFRAGADLNSSGCQFQLAQCYKYGYGVNKDLKQAVSWLKKAADAKHMGAQYNLGQCYELGLGVQKDRKQAIDWYRQAAEQGNSGAKTALARLEK
ncbi:MAG: tetratricopeptide repeat protein [bacterium]|nr:tetratricopeptide repeat protein [bacterium]